MNPTLDTLRALLPGWTVIRTIWESYAMMRPDGDRIIFIAWDDNAWTVAACDRAVRRPTLEDAAAYVRDEFGGGQ